MNAAGESDSLLPNDASGPSQNAHVIAALEELCTLIDQGRPLDRRDILERYPDIASELVKCLDGLDLIHDAAIQMKHSGSSAMQLDTVEMATRVLGDFRIVRELGRGGMGVVYEAEQLSMGRQVALKVLPFAALLDERQLQRFKNEARAAGSLHHPNIVPVFSVGTERGVHFYAMQYIDGPSLAEVLQDLQPLETSQHDDFGNSSTGGNSIDGGKPSREFSDPPQDKPDSSHAVSETRRELQAALSTQRSNSRKDYFSSVALWGQQAAEALAYAHQNGILHRDIKPGNLLLDASGKLLVTDFGLARLESDASMTMTGDVLGTLRFLSPEQALGKRVLVDHRADIYSLGITLYELATTRPAFSGRDREEVLYKIGREEPTPPAKIDREIPVDLETVILKAAAKAPEDRYASAEDLADDLSRFLRQLPIAAKPPSLFERSRKWLLRHQAAAWSAVLVFFLLGCISIIGFAWAVEKNDQLAMAVRDTERALANESLALKESAEANNDTRKALATTKLAESRANAQLYLATMRQAYSDLRQHETARFAESMVKFVPRETDQDLRGWEWFYLLSLYHQESQVLREHTGGVLDVEWHPQEKYLATSSGDGTVRLWDPSTWSVKQTIGAKFPARAIDWHPAGELLAVANSEPGAPYNNICIWNVVAGLLYHEFKTQKSAATSVAFSPDGSRFAAAFRADLGDTGDLEFGVKVWETSKLQEIWWHAATGARCVSWSPDGQSLACSVDGDSASVAILSVVDGTVIHEWKDFAAVVDHVAWSPGGDRILAAERKSLHLFDSASYELLHRVDAESPLHAIGWSPDGKRIATGIGRDVRVFTDKLHLERTLIGSTGTVHSIDWRSDGRTLAAGAAGGTTRIWNVSSRHNSIGATTVCADLSRETNENNEAFFSSTGRFIASRDPSSGEIIVRSLTDGTELQRFPADASEDLRAAWSGDDRWLAISADENREITVCNQANGQCQVLTRIDSGNIRYLDWNPLQPQLAAVVETELAAQQAMKRADITTNINIWNTESGELIHSISIRAPLVQIAWDPTGKRLASIEYSPGRGSAAVKVWDPASGEILTALSGHANNAGPPIWSPDGRRLVACGNGGQITRWDTHLGVQERSLHGHTNRTGGLWHPNGCRFLSYSDDGTLRLWDAASGEEILRLDGDYRQAAFNHNGSKLFLLGDDLDVINVKSNLLDAVKLTEYAIIAMIDRRDFAQAHQLIESLELGQAERRFLLRKLFSGQIEWMIGRDTAADGSLRMHLRTFLELWQSLVPEIGAQQSSRWGVSEFERGLLALLSIANLGPVYAAHYDQDPTAFLPVMEDICREVERCITLPSFPFAAKETVLDALDVTRRHMKRIRETGKN